MAGYIGSKASVVSSGAERKKVFDITTSTTVLTGLSYTANQVHVFHNGVRLISGTDYTETNDTTITLTNAAENGDQVVVVSYASFQTSDTVSASAGGTFSNDVTVNGDLTVDTNTLHVDSANNRVGVGNTSPTQALDVTGDIITSGGVYLGGTGSANKLDDYEEGTWTPVLTNYSGTYASQVGTYTKVGNLVSFSFYLETATAAGAGNTTLGGLPFASASGSNRYHAYQGWGNSWASNGAVQHVLGAGNTYLSMYGVVTSGGVIQTTVADIGSGANIIVSGTYTTDA